MVRKLLILTTILLIFPLSFISAQKDVLKQAKANLKNGDVKELQKMVDKITVNADTKDLADTWNVAGRVQYRKALQELEKAYLRKSYDTLTIYNSVLNMSKYFLKCDSIAQAETKPGKINKFRKDNQKSIVTEKGNLINGGIYFYNRAGENDTLKLAKSFDFFKTYIDLTVSDMFKDDDLLKRDSIFTQVAYYASLAAFRTNNFPQVLKYAPFAEDEPSVGQYALEFMAQAHQHNKNTEEWIETLKRGIEKYPEDDYFFANLIDYYSSNNNFEEALEFADGMLSKDPHNYHYLFVKGYLYQVMKQYDDALAYYERTVQVNPELAPAYSNMGLIYSLMA